MYTVNDRKFTTAQLIEVAHEALENWDWDMDEDGQGKKETLEGILESSNVEEFFGDGEGLDMDESGWPKGVDVYDWVSEKVDGWAG